MPRSAKARPRSVQIGSVRRKLTLELRDREAAKEPYFDGESCPICSCTKLGLVDFNGHELTQCPGCGWATAEDPCLP